MPGLLAALVVFGVVVIAHADVPWTFTPNEVVSSSKMNADFHYLAAAMPPGIVQAYAGHATPPPTGWLKCDGSPVSRTSYKSLFAAIGVSFGPGDGATTFNLPDLRGVFLRGIDDGVNRDPDASSRVALMPGGATGDAVGSYQADQLATHTHTVTEAQIIPGQAGQSGGCCTTVSFFNTATGQAGGSETRPKNVNVSYIIWSGVVP